MAVRILLALLLSASAFGQCGVERTPVKDLLDAAATEIHFDAQPITVYMLRQIPKPDEWHNEMERLDSEKQVYQLEADIIGYKWEKFNRKTGEGDGDYHVVLSTPGKPKETMILEIPNPACAAEEYKAIFAEMRAFIDTLGPKPSPKFVMLEKPVPVTTEGVTFFDKIHGQKGVAPNGIEFHPGLKLKRRPLYTRNDRLGSEREQVMKHRTNKESDAPSGQSSCPTLRRKS